MIHIRTNGTITAVLLLLISGGVQARAEEPQATKTAYTRYIEALETQLDIQNASGDKFLWIDQDAGRRNAVLRGQMPVERIATPQTPGGTLEHWIGGVFLPGVTLERVIQVDQDYAKYAAIYAPEMLRSQVIAHNGNHFTVLYRIKKHEILTVVLDVVNQIDFLPLGHNRYFVRSRGDDIRQVEDFGKPDEKDLPKGAGLGVLWAMNSYWRMEERDGGVYMECEFVTLSRSIPYGMGGLVRPIIKSLAEQSLTNMLTAKRRAMLAHR